MNHKVSMLIDKETVDDTFNKPELDKILPILY